MSGADLLGSRLLPALLIHVTDGQDLVGYLLCAGWILYQLVQLTHLLLNICNPLYVAKERVVLLLQMFDISTLLILFPRFVNPFVVFSLNCTINNIYKI